MKKKHARLICLLLVLVMSIGSAMTVFAAVPDDNTGVIVDADRDDEGIQLMSLQAGNESFWVGDSADNTTMTRVFHRQSGYRGPITINILNFNPSDYKVRIMVYGTDGLLLRDDDWMGTSGVMKVINKDGDQAIQSISIAIGPRPRLLFQAPYKQFQVQVSW